MYFATNLILLYLIIQKYIYIWHKMQIMKFHNKKFLQACISSLVSGSSVRLGNLFSKPQSTRVSERSLCTWHIYLFHHTCISFDPAHLCRHPHGQQRTWYIAASFVTSSVALKEAKASVMMASYQTQSNMVLHVLLLLSEHTWVVKVQGEWLQ